VRDPEEPLAHQVDIAGARQHVRRDFHGEG